MSPPATYSFTPAEVQYQLAHRDETKGPMILGVLGTFATLATISVMLRIWVRRINRNGFQADDYTIFIALVLNWCSYVAYYYGTKNGEGLHFVTITPEMFHRYQLADFTNLNLFVLSQMITQISLLLLYRRVFTLYRIWFRNTLAVIAFLALTSNLSTALATVFGCSPLRKSWDTYVTGGHCINKLRLYIAHAALSLGVDAAIVIAPLPLVWRLNTDRRTKAIVSGMVLLGSLVTILNPIKIYYLVTPNSGDVTYNGEAANILIHVQLSLGVVGATLPCLKPLLNKLRGHDHSGAKSTSGTLRSKRSVKQSASDQYNSLEGKEPSLAESDIGLVSLQQQWKTTPTFPGHIFSAHTRSVAEGGFPLSTDVIEQNLSLNGISVTRNIHIVSSRAA